jgi:hypothetical protein
MKNSESIVSIEPNEFEHFLNAGSPASRALNRAVAALVPG